MRLSLSPVLLQCMLLCAAPVLAQEERPLSQLEQWYRAGQFQQAAEQGLQDLLTEPWNHELRFMVADSLQRSGKVEQAIAQFEALDGTPLAASAALRLTAMRSGQVARSDKPGSAAASSVTAGRALMPSLPSSPRPGAAIASTGNPLAPASQSASGGLSGAVASGAAASGVVTSGAAASGISSPVAEETGTKVRPASTLRARVLLPRKPAAAQKIDDLAAKGDYEAVAKQGLLLLAQDANNHDLRLLVANSLAWTGFLDQAIVQYRQLLTSPVASDASIGLANALRWKGQDADALPLYQAVLARTPDNAAAQEGLRLAQRELRPRTTVTIGADQDSSDAHRHSLVIDQSWRDPTGKHLFEVEVAGVNDRIQDVRTYEGDVALRYQALGWPLQPKLEIGVQGNPQRQLVGNLRLHLGNPQSYIEVGHINWGKLASNAKALRVGLTANHLGLAYSGRSRWGELGARLDYYSISDDNEIISSGLRFVPAWRPLGNHVKFFVGTETRDARRGAVGGTYWAPVDGFGTGYGGFQLDFGGADWNLYSSAQIGGRLYGEAANNWSFSAGGKRWLGPDWALGINFFKLASTRDNASYRAKSLNMSLEKLWN